MGALSATSTGMPQAPATNAANAATATTASAQPSAAETQAAQDSLTQPDATYPNLTALQVGLLQGIGTPANVIGDINGRDPEQAWLDSYIQDEIMQDPEGWDAFCGNPAGTARAGLTQLLPGVALPPAGAGTGSMPSDSGAIPGVTVPILDTGATPVATKSGTGEGIVKAVVIGAVVVGVGLLAWKFMKGRGAAGAGDAAKGAEKLMEGLGGAAKGGTGAELLAKLRLAGVGAGAAGVAGHAGFGSLLGGGGAGVGGAVSGLEAGLSGAVAGGMDIADIGKAMVQQGILADNVTIYRQGAELVALAQGGEAAAATVGGILRGQGVASGQHLLAAATAAAVDLPFKDALKGITDLATANAGGGVAEHVAEGFKLALQQLAAVR